MVEAAKTRIKNLFDCGGKVYLSFSCGKDSLCMASLTYDLILAGTIDRKQLTVIFVDEEGLYKSMVDAATRWRNKFEHIGVPFLWLCLPFKQVSVLDRLSASESWITWAPTEQDKWMRTPPPYAIVSHPVLQYPGQMNYQAFCTRAFSDGVQMIGLRTVESLTRYQAVAKRNLSTVTPGCPFYPIYDWKDSDVWLYIKEHNLEFPEIYIRLYEAGVTRNNLRLCAFFGDCGTQGLRWIAETDHELWERIERRMPNAYLVLLYWDSEMFRRQTRKRSELEDEAEKKDYLMLCKDILFMHPQNYTIPADTSENLSSWRNLFLKTHGVATEKHYKRMYEALLYGDPKSRVLRILWSTIYNDYNSKSKVVR